MDGGDRLVAQSPWLRLLLVHLSGPTVRGHVEVDDLVQETLLRALASPAGLPPEAPGEGPLRGLLATIARHCVMDVLRRLRAAKRSGRTVRLSRASWSRSGLPASALPAAGPGPATRAGQAEQEAALLAAFERLSPEHRRVIGLRQLEGLGAEETGRRMGRSAAAVHSLYRRALAAWERGAGVS